MCASVHAWTHVSRVHVHVCVKNLIVETNWSIYTLLKLTEILQQTVKHLHTAACHPGLLGSCVIYRDLGVISLSSQEVSDPR